MIAIIWFLITFIISHNHGEFMQQFRPFTPVIAPYPPPCQPGQVLMQTPPLQPIQQLPPLQPRPQLDNGNKKQLQNDFAPNNSTEGLRFLLPFMDIDIEIERRVHVMQEFIHEEIFILHGHELFQLFLSRQEKRLNLMGYLEGSVRIMEPLAAEVVFWQGHLILVVALDEHLEIYQIRRDILQSRAEILQNPRRIHEIAPVFPAVQQLTLRGRFHKLFIFVPNENHVMIVAVVNFSKLYGKIRTFGMSRQRFEPIEEMTVAAVNLVNVIGWHPKYVITGKRIKNKSKTILTLYQVDESSLQLHNKQTLTVESLVVHSTTFRNKNLIIACSSKQVKCQIYLQLSNGSFVAFKDRTSQELVFNHISANSKFILASRQNQVMVFTDHFMDCYGSFTPDLLDISNLLAHHNSRGENFVLVINKSPFRLLIRTVEMEINDKFRKSRSPGENEMRLATEHKLFLKSLVDQARSFLPPRKEDMNIFHRMADFVIPKSTRFENNKSPSNNPFERFTEMFIPKRPEPEEIDLIDMFENLFIPKSEAKKTTKSTSDIFGMMEDMVKPKARQVENTDPFTNMFESFVGLIRPKRKNLESEEPVKLKSGRVNKIQIKNSFLRSPTQILDRVRDIKNKYLGAQRRKRSEAGGGPFNITLELKNHVKVQIMRVKNLIYKGDLINGFSLNVTSKPLAKLVIKPKAIARSVKATEIEYPENNRDIRQFVPDLYYDLTPSIGAKHLKVGSINGLPWSEFYESIFLKNRDTTIAGRLVLQSQVDVDHLKTPTLNDIEVGQLFNLRQPQVIQSELVISRFFVHDLKAEKVNGLKFEEDIVFSGKEAFVETPVTMHHLKISGDLIVADKKIERFSDNSNEMEFKQFYTNKVIINGTLVLNNLKRENGNRTKIVIGAKILQEDDIKKQYLLKDENQHFTFPIRFDNTKVIAPQLDTKYLNDHLTQDHMLTDKVNNTKPLLIVFMKTQVQGDIICRDYKSKIAEIQENLIRIGDVVKITGKKKFEAPVATNDLQTSALNQLSLSDFIFKTDLNGPLKFRNSKAFNSIIVNNPCFVEKGIDAMYLNNLGLEDLLNHDYHMERLHVSHTLLVSNIVFHKINGIPFDEFFTKLGVRDNQLILHKDLIVEGNVVFVDPVELESINDLIWNNYIENLARTNEKAIIEGNICIYGDLAISEDLWADEVNGHNLQDIFRNILMKSKPQLITGHYTFDNLKASNVDLLSINGRPAKEYIDLSKNYTEFKGDIIAPKIIVRGSLSGFLDQPFNFDNLSESVKKLSFMSWRNVQVMKNVSWNQGPADAYNIQQELLKYLYKNSVRSNQNQIISGNVKLVGPVIKNMRTRLQFPNGIDLNFIEIDAVLRNTTSTQNITGFKNFLKPIHVNKLEAQIGIKTRLLNNIDIIRFNHSLYRLSSKLPMEGPLQFRKPLIVGHLALKGLLNGLNSTVIYEIKNNSVLPPVSINQLFVVSDINVKSINRMSLQYFLDNRVTLKGPALEIFGFLKFENLMIEKDALLQSINKIAIDNLVFKHSLSLQSFTGHKSVNGFVELAGPAHVMRLNDKDLMELYRNTLLSDQDYEFDSLIADKVTLEKGLQVLNSNMRQRSFSEMEAGEGQDFQKFLLNVDQNVSSTSGNILYLDYDWNTRVKWQNSNNSSTDNIFLREISRISCCEKQFLKLSYSKVNEALYLENITSNRLSTFADNIAVKIENYCKFKYRKVKSKISISAPKLLKVFGLKRFVEAIDILSNASSHQHHRFVIIHALDLPSLKRNEVRVFKIDSRNNSIQDWQGLTQNIGEKLKVFQLSNITALLTNGIIDNHPALTIYHFNYTVEKFKLQQIVDGDYDIIEMLQLHNGSYQQLIISCRKCQKIYIYEFDPNQQPNYQIFQIISLKSNIDKLFMFSFKNNNYMLVLLENEAAYYHLYKYSYIRGWLHTTYGYFPNLQMSIPLSEMWSRDHYLTIADNSDSIPLLVLCNFDNCHVVNAVIHK